MGTKLDKVLLESQRKISESVNDIDIAKQKVKGYTVKTRAPMFLTKLTSTDLSPEVVFLLLWCREPSSPLLLTLRVRYLRLQTTSLDQTSPNLRMLSQSFIKPMFYTFSHRHHADFLCRWMSKTSPHKASMSPKESSTTTR